MAKKEKIVDEYRRNLHDIAVARSEEILDELLEKTQNLIMENSALFNAHEYTDNLATLRIFYWKAKTKIQEGI